MKTTFAVAAWLLIAAGSSAFAQQRYVPPAGPTLPNELNYFRRDTGVLDQYNQFVAPRRRLENDLRSLQMQQNVQAQRQEELAVAQRNLAIRPTGAAPTGTGATFMNYSHYFPMARPAGGIRRR